MGYKCVVLGCFSSGKSVPKHHFPKNEIRAFMWREMIKCELKIYNISSDRLYKYYICHKHFSSSMVKLTGTRRCLIEDAYPDIDNLTCSSSDSQALCMSANVSLESNEMNLNIKVSNHLDNLQALDDGQVFFDGVDVNDNIFCDKLVDTLEVDRARDNLNVNNELSAVVTTLDCSTDNKNDTFKDGQSSKSVDTKKVQQSELNRLKIALRSQKKRTNALKSRYKKKCAEVRALKKLNLLSQNSSLTSIQKVFIEMQYEQGAKKSKARRFTMSQKLLSLIIHERSPTAHKLLSSLFTIPSSGTLKKVLDKIRFDTGIASIMSRYLQVEGKRLSASRDKYVTVIWDETATTPHLDYDVQNDKIAGFEDYGYKRTIKFADHVLIVAIHSANSSQFVPVYHGFCESQTSPADLTKIVKLVFDKLIDNGLTPVATVCDQGTNNVKTIKNLLLESNRLRFKRKLNPGDTILYRDCEIVPLFDSPHLVKGTRNNLLTKTLRFDHKALSKASFCNLFRYIDKSVSGFQDAHWKYIEKAYRIDKNRTTGSRVTNLTDEHIYEKKIHKMRVAPAAQIFSVTTSNLIKSLVDSPDPIMTTEGEQKLGQEALFTAEILLYFNDLFDSMNGSQKNQKTTTPLRSNVTESSLHHKFWASSQYFLPHLKFLDPKNPEKKAFVPTLENWKINVVGFQKLYLILKKYGFEEFSPRHFNQDDLESTFGWLRQRSCNRKPSCKLITRHLRSFLIDKVGRFKIRHGNTESAATVDDSQNIDFCDVIATFNNFLLDADCVDSDDNDGDANDVDDSLVESNVKVVAHSSKLESTTVLPNILLHLSRNNEIMQQLMKSVVGCDNCIESFIRNQDGLTVDSSFDRMYFQVLKVINDCIVVYGYRKNISENLKSIVQERIDDGKIDKSWLTCTNHYKEINEKAINIIIRRLIVDWCAAVNDHLSGKSNHLKNANYIFYQSWKTHQKTKKVALQDKEVQQ